MKISIQSIADLLRHADIEGLIESGAPADEYAAEANVLYQALSQLESGESGVAGLVEIISEVWRQSFDLGAAEMLQRKKAIENIAQQLMATAS